MNEQPKLHRVALKCLVCGADKLPLEAETETRCDICGELFTADSTCENSHFVCIMCRQVAARASIMRHCLESGLDDPYALMLELMALPGLAMHGPEHHLLLTAALLTAFANAQQRADLAELLETANRRSLQVPGGICGNWGVCGAAIGAGIFMSLVTGSSPFAEAEWRTCGQLTARCAHAISEQGGPRCCKRDSFTALLKAIAFSNETLGTAFRVPETVVCRFYPNNSECKGKDCPFFPAGQKAERQE